MNKYFIIHHMNTYCADLFESLNQSNKQLTLGAIFLPKFARPVEQELLRSILAVSAQAPFRNMTTPGGYIMSVAMTNCGQYGWVTDKKGYRYESIDPMSQKPWPKMPNCFLTLAQRAATQAGYSDFQPDSCLINRYQVGAKMSLHQDKDEADLNAPIVSVSLGLSTTFLFGGLTRTDKVQRILLQHGDVVVWGGPARLFYHGVNPLKAGTHPLLGNYRINLTFRRAR